MSTNLESSRASPSSTVARSGVSARTANASLGASSTIPRSPPIRRTLFEDTGATPTSYEGANLFKRDHEDGTVFCTRGDCLTVLPSLQAFLSHSHIHLIHEGYVAHLQWRDVNWITDYIVSNKQAECV